MAKVVADAALLLGYTILGFIDDTPMASSSFLGKKVLSILPPPDNFEVICAIGDCDARMAICTRLETNGYRFASIFHPKASISLTSQIGQGVYIAANAVIDPSVVIDNYSIINNSAVISHGTHIGQACHLAPSTVVSGNCNVGNAVWLGVGSVVIENTSIGDRAFIGAGSVVTRNIQSNNLVYGVPARKVKIR